MSDPTLPANIREFHCYHCRGKIRIPRELPPTTAPCPHCKNIITSPAPEATASISSLPPAPAAYPSIPHHHVNESVPQTAQESPSGRPIEQPAAQPTYHTPTVPSPLEVSQVPQPITGASPSRTEQTAPGAVILAPPTSGEQNPIEVPSNQSAPQQPSTAPTSLPIRGSSSRRKEPKEETKKSSTSAVPAIFLGCLLLSIAAGAGYLVYHEMAGKAKTPIPSNLPQNTSLSEGQYMRVGWKKDAYDVLGKFLAATTVEEKLPYIINGNQLRSQVEAFYGGSVINDQDTPIEAFSARELPDEDKKRGIFMLEFEQPPQFEMKEFFRPLATLEIQYGIDEANLLFSTMARVENFATAPVRATALFKKTPEGLKLDWETFAQTKYRTFANLVELPESGQVGVFRVIISEDVPESGRTLPPGIKTYRIWDPSAPETSTRVNVNIDSEIGRTLSKIDWRGKENRATNSTATIELKWVGTEQPKLEITRFICWEFLHLGGTETAAAPR